MIYQSVEESLQRDVWTPSRLNSEVRAVLEGSFPLLWVEGEISNLALPASGHIYFTLKDQHAQVRCAMFRMKRQHLRFAPQNGSQVLMRCRVSLYEARGEFQLTVEHMEPAGEGALRLAFEALKQKLDAEGLFATDLKRALPAFPRRIGVVTSPSGAALHDILTVLERRFPSAGVIIYPVQVQGKDAAAEITAMINLADRRAECDLLILARGGGSLEDLAAFNDEQLARAIHKAKLPIVSAVGHEIDFTIADFVADRRAATPSAAAELVSPDRVELESQIQALGDRLMLRMRQALAQHTAALLHLDRLLLRVHPGNRVRQWQQRLDELQLRLHKSADNVQQQRSAMLNVMLTRLAGVTPLHRLQRTCQQQQSLSRRLFGAMESVVTDQRQRLAKAAANLHTLSPLATLQRGYSITRRVADNGVVRNAAEVQVGEKLETLLAHGRLTSKVVSVTPE